MKGVPEVTYHGSAHHQPGQPRTHDIAKPVHVDHVRAASSARPDRRDESGSLSD